MLAWCGPAAGDELFGLGSRNAALAGAVSPVCEDGAAAWYNPAALGRQEGGGLGLFFVAAWPEVTAQVTQYGSLGQVPAWQRVGEDGALSASRTREAVDAAFDRAAAMETFSAVGVHFALPFQRLFAALPFPLVLGGNVLIPESGGSLAHFSAQTVDEPFFPSFNTPFNQSQMHFGLGAQVWPDVLWLGAALAVHSQVEGSVVTLNPVASYDPEHPERNPPAASQSSTDQRLGLSAAWSAGVLARPVPWGHLAVVFHSAEETSIRLGATAVMELDLGEPLRMEVPYVMSGVFAYRPPRVVAGVGLEPLEGLTLTAELEWGAWSMLEDHLQYLTIDVDPAALDETGALYLEDLGGRFRVASAGRPPVRARDTFAPRAGAEYRFDAGLALRAGYAYRPAPLEENQGHLNVLLDNAWHEVGAGAGWRLLAGDAPETWLNAHFQGRFLVPRYHYVGKPSTDTTLAARGIARSEGHILGFGVEVVSRF